MNPSRSFLILFLACGYFHLSAEAPPILFADYFQDRTLRIDYFHSGNAKEEHVAIDRLILEGPWAGSFSHLDDPFELGRYAVQIRDLETKKLIYATGFDSYFGEYKTTDPALKGIPRTYHESVLIPQPKKPFQFTFLVRNRENVLQPVFSQELLPESPDVFKHGSDSAVRITLPQNQHDPHHSADLVIVAEGYTLQEENKFQKDMERVKSWIFSIPPFQENREQFNVFGAFRASPENGCDEPEKQIFRRTALSASFYALHTDRYLLTEDNRALRDIAGHVPYDKIIIIVNSKRYGGGGIYNQYCISTVDHDRSKAVLLHELGHSFAGLADEYYNSDVAYNDFYPPGIEPLEPNLTALLDPALLKWRHLVSSGTPLPTPWEKVTYDTITREFPRQNRKLAQEIAQLKKEGASAKSIARNEKELKKLHEEFRKKMASIFDKSPMKGKVGAYEGAGYASRGLFRPMLECMMFSQGNGLYCKVCEEAARNMILHLCE